MEAVGLIMAGGRSARMRSSGLGVPKPLLHVGGVALLERNLHAMVRAGLREVVVSTSSASPDVERFVASRLRAVAGAVGVDLTMVHETSPLGNIGAAGLLADRHRPVLVAYADNLTTLDLAAVVDRHRATGAAFTLAVHEEPVQLPYGELTLDGDEVVAYDEKPVRRSLIASAISVIAPDVVAALPGDRPTGMVDLFAAVRRDGGRVTGFGHKAPWVDVNDAAALDRAEDLLVEHQVGFDRWAAPDRVVDVGLVVRGDAVLLTTVPDGRWTLPAAGPGPSVLELDALDEGRVARYRVVDGPPVPEGAGVWRPLAGIGPGELTEVARRVLVVALGRRDLSGPEGAEHA